MEIIFRNVIILNNQGPGACPGQPQLHQQPPGRGRGGDSQAEGYRHREVHSLRYSTHRYFNNLLHIYCNFPTLIRLNQFEQSKMTAPPSLGRSGVSRITQNKEGEDAISCYKCNIMTSNYQVPYLSLGTVITSWSGMSRRPECRVPRVSRVSAVGAE